MAFDEKDALYATLSYLTNKVERLEQEGKGTLHLLVTANRFIAERDRWIGELNSIISDLRAQILKLVKDNVGPPNHSVVGIVDQPKIVDLSRSTVDDSCRMGSYNTKSGWRSVASTITGSVC